MNDRPVRRPMLAAFKVSRVALFVIAVHASLLGQVTSVAPEQAPPTPGVRHDFIESLAETVSPATGSLSIRIPLSAPAGRGLVVPFLIGYDSNSANHLRVTQPTHEFWTDNSSYLGVGGWSYLLPSLSVSSNTIYVGPGGGPPGQGGNTPCTSLTNYLFNDGAILHSIAGMFVRDPQQDCVAASGSFEGLASGDAKVIGISDQPGFIFSAGVPAFTLSNSEGTVYHFPAGWGHFYPADNSTYNPHLDSSQSFKIPDWIETRNGNKALILDQGQGKIQVTDSLGRISVTTSGFGSSLGDSISVVGLATPFKVTWASRTYNWSYSRSVTLPPTPSPLCGSSSTSLTASGSQLEIQQITLPNGQAYTFQYDSVYGLVKQITYPTGAYVVYDWDNYSSLANPVGTLSSEVEYPDDQPSDQNSKCQLQFDVPAVAHRHVFVGGVEVQRQDFSYSTVWATYSGGVDGGFHHWTSKTATVITNDLVAGTSFKTVYTYAPLFLPVPPTGELETPVTPVEQTVQQYDTNGSPLRTVAKTYVDSLVPPIDERTTVGNGQTSEVLDCYLGITSLPAPCPQNPAPPLITFQGGSYSLSLLAGLLEDRFEYDYGPGTPGALLRHTHIDYAQFTTPLFQGPTNLNHPKDVITYDGSAHRVAEVDYGYDETSLSPATGVGHDDQNFGTGFVSGRGNVTTQAARCFSILNGLPQNCPQGDSVTQYTYDVTGQLASKKDPDGNTTTYSYTDNFYDPKPPSNAPLPAGNTNAYLTQITYPKTGATNHVVSFSYAYSDGQVTTQVDENNQKTTYIYSDLLRRLTEVDFNSTATTLYDYHNDSLPLTVTTTVVATPDPNIVNSTIYDGFGRVANTSLDSDPAGADLAYFTYDGQGHKRTESNPYRGNSPDGVTTHLYDALGRVSQTTKQDGSVASVQYNQPASLSTTADCTTATDELGNPRRTCADALGRLVEVDEPSSSSFGTNAAVSVTISGSLQTSSSVSGTPAPLAASGSALSGYESSSVTNSWLYEGADQHLYNVYWNNDGTGRGYADATLETGLALPAPNSSLSWYADPAGTPHWLYEDANQHEQLIWISGGIWGGVDNTVYIGSPVAAPGSPLTTMEDTNWVQQWAYLGPNQDLYEAFGVVHPGYTDGTAAINAPAAASNSKLATYFDGAQFPHWIYEDNNGHVQLLWNVNGTWGGLDIKNNANSPFAASGSPLTSKEDSNCLQQWAYFDTNQHLIFAHVQGTQGCGGTGSVWGSSDGTAAIKAPAAAPNSKLATYFDPAQIPHWIYEDSNGHIQLLWWQSTGWGGTDITLGSGSPPAASGSALAAYEDTNCLQHWLYFGTNQHLIEVHFSGSTGCSGTGAYGYTDVNALTPNMLTDSGTVSLTVGSFTATACFGNSTNPVCAGRPVNNTASQVAATLAQSLNSSFDSPVTATASGPSISMVWKTPGTVSETVPALSTTHDNSTLFSMPSFTSQAATFGGGTGPSLSNGYTTLYSYDALGNLLRVDQRGTAPSDSTQWRTRLFTYDSLSRLLTAYNPESGTTVYSYDADGNVIQKTSPAPNQNGAATQQISYCYDALHRLTDKSYTAQAPVIGQPCALTGVVVHDTYDVGANGIGRLTSVTDQAGSANYNYDNMGRLTGELRTTAGKSMSMSYGYDFAGALNTMTYPSTAVITYTPDGSGRNLSAVDKGKSINYATGASYAPDGSITGFISGNSTTFSGITNSFTYNNRLQPITISAAGSAGTVLSLTYDFHLGAGDNGNVWAITNNRDTMRTQSFTYDALNRLTSAQNAGTDCSKTTINGKTEYWANTYVYDAWGNLTDKNKTGCGAEDIHFNTDAHNWLHVKAGADYAYDAAGNMTFNAHEGQNYTYDAENRITGAAGFAYSYDADGNRVAKSNGTTGTLYWYMSPGIVAESDLSGNLTSEYVFFDGERIARRDNPGSPNATVAYYFSDHLKTASVITDSSGTIKSDSDYYPWGGELEFIANDSNHYKFTGKERDTETGLDYFGARYYSNGLGRFITPDWAAKATAVPYADFADPQSLNLYTYVRNIPTTRLDPDGHDDFMDLARKLWQSLMQPVADASSSKGSSPAIDSSPSVLPSNTTATTHEIIADISQKEGTVIGVANDVVAAADPTGQAAVLNSKLKGDDLGVALAAAGPLLGAAGKTEKAIQDGVSVYQIVKDGEVSYVGITNNLARRSAEHGAALEEVAGGLTRKEARSVEQALIQHHGLAKNGGTLENKINSISPQHSGFREAVEFGLQVLQGLGYF